MELSIGTALRSDLVITLVVFGIVYVARSGRDVASQCGYVVDRVVDKGCLLAMQCSELSYY